MIKFSLVSGVVFGLLTVVIGAFGAHALNAVLVSNERLDVYETAVQYQSIHALVLMIVGLLGGQYSDIRLKWVVLSIFFGVMIFSGSLYFLSITNISWLGAITPIGGMLLIAGWVFLLVEIIRKVK